MRLKRLEIYGFKSFADRTVVEFDEGITGIVGPNGSGKSNLSDAVRWVLGEQSAKSLRGGKMEDVIFGGTDRRKKMGYCEVSLVFENLDHALSVDYTEVMITRRVYRSGEGEYYINKTACRLRDIIDLFRDTGIGRDGYSIIGQGRIDEILSQKSEDRRGIFEEAAGITKYRARKEESEKRLSNTQENLTRVEDIVAELEKQLEPLAKASEVARRYLALRDELRILDCSAFVVRTDRNQVRIQEAQNTLNLLKSQIEEQEAESSRLSGERETDSEKAAELERAVTGAHGEVLELTREKEAREGELQVMRTELAQLEKEVLSETQERDVKKARLEAVGEEIRENRQNHESANRKIADLQHAIEEKETEIDGAVKAAQDVEDRLDAHKARIIDSMNRQSDVRTMEARLSATRQNLERRAEEAAAKRAELTEDRATLDVQVREADQGLADAREQCSRQEVSLSESEAESKRLSETARQLQGTDQELSGTFKATESRLHVLREMERDYAGYQQAVKQVLIHAEGNPDVHGVVASLMQVPKEYERAIEAVLGGALQNIVTTNEYVARDMIAYLRQNKQGRATFLPMSTIRGRVLDTRERQLLSMPGCLGQASELISFDNRYRGIMENLLGRTVIAENLDAGIEIMRRGNHAFRLVTVEGDVMHSGGSMTGGSANSRMTSLLSRDREIKEHEAKLAEIRKAQAACREERAAIEQQQAALREKREQMFEALNQYRIDVSIAEERLRMFNGKLSEQDREEQECDTLISQIAASIEQIDLQLAGVHESQEDDAQSTEAMNEQTAVLSDELYARREQLEKLREEGQALRIDLTASQRDLDALVRDGQRLMQEEKRVAQEMGEAVRLIEANTLKHQEQTELIATRSREQDGCKASLAAAEANLATKTEARTEVQKRISALTERIESIHESISAASEQSHRAEMTLTRLQGELETLGNRIWEDYELTYAGAKEYLTEGFELGRGERRAGEIRTEIRGMGPVNVSAVEEYRATRERYEGLASQRDDLVKAKADLQQIIEQLVRQMEQQFLENFRLLQTYLSETFTRLFDGGRAELRLQDENDILGCGIDIVAQPPGKKLQMLSLLSGGERALTAIAILFAMLRLKPTPFCFLDEIEAALDDGNIATFADYLKDFSKSTQFVIVTHRKGTMERCDSLYGVAMEERGVSKILSVELKDIKEDALQ
ncbi:MAG: chromosome segregation protein SMC [Clostridia bacterium]|nr:chromosome segregation protein SMC [Clostridia bacterium]